VKPPDLNPDARAALRVVLVDDSSLFRHGLAALLIAGGIEVSAELSSVEAIPAVIGQFQPDVMILDVRMPPTHTDEGIEAAIAIREAWPTIGVLVLSTYAEGTWASKLFHAGTDGLGYLLKDRVDDVAALIDAIRRVASGGTALDPEVISRLLAVTRQQSALKELSDREREVLSLMAEGLSNVGIGKQLHVSPRTVEAYIAAIFIKLPLDAAANTLNRRVLAVLTYLNELGLSPRA
jgi:DNA-binding NarL/FixJ family response regulator